MRNRIERDKLLEPKKEKNFNLNLIEEKRKDEINEKLKSRMIMLSTYEGYAKLRQNLL